MCVLLVNLYEFGQFLRILLWITLPVAVVSMLVTTWLHYRRNHKMQDVMLLSVEGLDPSADPELLMAAVARPSFSALAGDGEGAAVTGDPVTPEEKENMYRGILWMKEKYEQYRDLADRKLEELKMELDRSEKKYQDLLLSLEERKSAPPELAAMTPAPPEAPSGMDQRIDNGARLEEKQYRIEELEGQLHTERQKTEELVARLQHSSQLLLNLYQELDKSLHPAAEETP